MEPRLRSLLEARLYLLAGWLSVGWLYLWTEQRSAAPACLQAELTSAGQVYWLAVQWWQSAGAGCSTVSEAAQFGETDSDWASPKTPTQTTVPRAQPGLRETMPYEISSAHSFCCFVHQRWLNLFGQTLAPRSGREPPSSGDERPAAIRRRLRRCCARARRPALRSGASASVAVPAN